VSAGEIVIVFVIGGLVGGLLGSIVLRGYVIERSSRLRREFGEVIDLEKTVRAAYFSELQQRVERLEVHSSFGPSTTYRDYPPRPQPPQQPVTVDEAIELLDTSFKVPALQPKDKK
jgi:hypothetical protein